MQSYNFICFAKTDFPLFQGVPVEVVNKGSIKNIHVHMEDRMGGRKHATKLSHVESFALDPNELAGELQRKFQVSFLALTARHELPMRASMCVQHRRPYVHCCREERFVLLGNQAFQEEKRRN